MSVMKLRRAIVALTVVATAVPGVVTAQGVADSAHLHEFVETYQTVLNTHDPTAVAAFFSEDADLVPGNLPALHGRGAIEAWWRTYFERQQPERRGLLDVASMRFLTRDVAVVNLAITSGGGSTGGEVLPVRKARGTWLLRRHGGQWLIEAARILPTEKDRVELMSSLEAAESLRPQLRVFVAAYEDTFNRHDPAAISAFYTEDADIVVRNSPVIHGRQAIIDWWRAYFSKLRPQPLDRDTWFESMKAILIIDEIRMIGPDVALVDISATAAARQADGGPLPVRYARATWVVVREGGEWLIAALRVLPSEDDRVIREHEQDH
jgi:uncharacterized protein (TIGR02246 family)